MEVRREHDRFPIQIILVVIGLALALLFGGGAGYALRGPVAQQSIVSEAVTRDQVEDWMRQGNGPTDADADQTAPRQCEGYACTLEGEQDLAERAAVAKAQERTESATGKP